MIEHCERIGFTALPYILWKKPTNKPNAFLGSGFVPPNGYVTLDCEYILIFRKGGPRTYPPHDARRYESSFTRQERDKWFSQVWDDMRGTRQTHGDISRRTGAYPEELARRLIRMFSVNWPVVSRNYFRFVHNLISFSGLKSHSNHVLTIPSQIPCSSFRMNASDGVSA